jgi:hypothetical protein
MDGGRVIFDGSPDEFLAAPPYAPMDPWRAGVAAVVGRALAPVGAAR